MRVLIAPDSFKGTLTAHEAAEAMSRGVRETEPSAEIVMLPIADGGDGMVEVILSARGGERRKVRVMGPLGEPVDATIALIDDGTTALVESAAAIGLTLIPEGDRDPLQTTSYGLGELILAAATSGANRVVVGLGGSSTNDGGVGMAQALGVTFHGVPSPATGADLPALTSIELATRDAALEGIEVIAACDVTNPLLGPTGATRTYGPQKGASAAALDQLETGLAHLAALLPNVDRSLPGTGAAGGLGFGLAAFCDASIVGGAAFVLDILEVDRHLTKADLVLTGEGRMDGQSLHGKACIVLSRRAKAAQVPVVAIVGSTGPGIERVREAGIRSWTSTEPDDGCHSSGTQDNVKDDVAAATIKAIQTYLIDAS